MSIKQLEIQNKLREIVSSEISLLEEGIDRFRVFTPFEFEDGDHFSIVLKKNGEYWIFSDDAHTIMHMSYDMDISVLKKGNRQKTKKKLSFFLHFNAFNRTLSCANSTTLAKL